MSSPLVSVDSLVTRLRTTQGSEDLSATVHDLLGSLRLDENTLRPFIRFSLDHYTRHLIHRDPFIEIMVLCWSSGQGTPIHNHDGQLGWAIAVQGDLECVEYTVNGDVDLNLPVEDLEGLTVQLDQTSQAVCTPGGGVNPSTARDPRRRRGSPNRFRGPPPC